MNRKTILAAAACAATLAVTQAAMAQLSLTGTSYSQNFDLIAASVAAASSAGTAVGGDGAGGCCCSGDPRRKNVQQKKSFTMRASLFAERNPMPPSPNREALFLNRRNPCLLAAEH